MGQKFSKLSCTSGGARTNGNSARRKVSAETKIAVTEFMERNPTRELRMPVAELRELLSLIPTDEDIFLVYYETGFNLLQKCIGENNVEAVHLLLSRNPDLNSGPCSLPLHIACLKGYTECVEDLVEHGARLDVGAQMCWPGPHRKGCPGRKNESKQYRRRINSSGERPENATLTDKCKNALFYAIDGEQCNVLDYLLGVHKRDYEDTLELQPLLKAASGRESWSCFNLLLESKADEIDSSIFRDFVDPRPGDNVELTLFHVLFFIVNKPADFTLRLCKAFLLGSLKSQIGTVDHVGNTPLHSLIIRYAFEESKRLWLSDNEPWEQAETKQMILLLLENGADKSVSEPGNSTMSLIVNQLTDWRFIYDLLNIILDIGASPVIKDRRGHCPLMACIIKLINNSLFDTFDAESKLFFMNSLRVLCQAGANPNCLTQSTLTPLHVLVFTVAENFSSTTDEEMNENFEFIKDILVLLFEFGLDANVVGIEGAPSVFHGILKLVQKSSYAVDLERVYDLLLTLIQYGVNPNTLVDFPNAQTFLDGREIPFAASENGYLLGYMFIALAEKEDILNECDEDIFIQMLYLLYFSMDHKDLYKCLNYLEGEFSTVPPTRTCEVLKGTVTEMLSQPRTLKQSARVVINRSMGRKPGIYANQLPLAKKLRDYLINYEP